MATSRANVYRRKIYFIDRKFQANFILKFCALVIVGGIVTMAVLYLCTTQSSTVAFVNSRAVVRTTADFLLPLVIQTVVIVTILIGIAAIAMTLFVSHKIAGPLYRLKKIMEALGEGEISGGFRLRHKDQLQELARSLNETMMKMRSKASALKELAKKLDGALGGISEHDVAEGKARQELKESKRIVAELEKVIQYFRF
jgi:methyl-accepting chemotaxis protein